MGTILLGVEPVFVPCEILHLGEYMITYFDFIKDVFTPLLASKISYANAALSLVGNGIHAID